MFHKKNTEKLQGQDNQRAGARKPTNNEGTAAWQSAEGHYKTDQVNKPSLDRVVDAKDWVDNGSKL